MKKHVIITPYWGDILFAITLLAISQWDSLFMRSTGYAYHQQRFFLVCGVYLLITKCNGYVVYSKGILVCWFVVPFRLIKWDSVSAAEYLCHWHAWKSDQQFKGHGIFVTLPSAPIFRSESDGLQKFLFQHPFSAYFIRFTRLNRQKCVEVFKQYHPELSFQAGCDTSWLMPTERKCEQ